MKCFYFGAWSKDRLGHYLHAPGGSTSRMYEEMLPFACSILDSRLLPNGEEVEGRVQRSVINGWTVLSFWDRSADSRGKSNSAFVMEGVHDSNTVIRVAREQFPAVFERFSFPLQLPPTEDA